MGTRIILWLLLLCVLLNQVCILVAQSDVDPSAADGNTAEEQVPVSSTPPQDNEEAIHINTEIPVQEDVEITATVEEPAQPNASEHVTADSTTTDSAINSDPIPTVEAVEPVKPVVQKPCACKDFELSLNNPFVGKMILTVVPFLFFLHLHNHELL